MGLKVIQKRASDLQGMYVGETEKNIAAAFLEASDKNAILVFDEADSFLRDRTGAYRSWEVSAVNEMLTQMESSRVPFICTTNLMSTLDKAALRRFTFKVKYDFMKPEQVAAAFRHFFGAEPTVALSHLTHLAPGDFVVVKNKAKILNIIDQAELARMLAQEMEVKGEKPRNKIGF
jgi:SpoVK/Ycf46/Vps4 family AAA+-type ATPase